MFTKRNITAVLIAMIIPVVINAQVREHRSTDLRSLAMGGTVTGIGRSAYLLSNNIAELAMLPKSSFRLIDLSASLGSQAIKDAKAFSGDIREIIDGGSLDRPGRLDILHRLGSYADDAAMNIRLSASPLGIATRGFGFGVFADTKIGVSKEETSGKSTVTMNSTSDFKAVTGFATNKRIGCGSIAWGFGITFRYLRDDIHTGEFTQSPESDAGEGADQGLYYGSARNAAGVGFDVGGMYQVGGLRIGLAAHDVGKTRLTWKSVDVADFEASPLHRVNDSGEPETSEHDRETIEYLDPSFCLGMAYYGDFDVLGFFRDFRIAGELRKKSSGEIAYNAGAEARFMRVFRVRCGIDENERLTYGAGFRFLCFDCDAASYWLPAMDSGAEGEKAFENIYGASVGISF
jgi:hypothetical protein